MPKVRFFKAGRWACASPRDPQFSVKADEVVSLDDATAKIVVDAGAGEVVAEPDPEPDKSDGDEKSEGEDKEDSGKTRKPFPLAKNTSK